LAKDSNVLRFFIAGIAECDVTFTKDIELVCRHAQYDLHTTTDVVNRPLMNVKCTTPWSPGLSPKCCTSGFTLAEIKTLCAKMDSSGDDGATTAEEYAFGNTADWRIGEALSPWIVSLMWINSF
jgi:glycerophosphoryl diester phosphodiesterase